MAEKSRQDHFMKALDGMSIKLDGELGTLDEVIQMSLTDMLRRANIKVVDDIHGKEYVIRSAKETDKSQPPEIKQTDLTGIRTQDVIDSLIRLKKYKRVKPATIETYQSKLAPFAKAFPLLPMDSGVIMSFVERFTGDTGRHKRNNHDLINMIYKHAVKNSMILSNPMDRLERPVIKHLPIRTLSLEEATTVNRAIHDLTEKAAWHLAFGHGWRQVEIRRVKAGDVRAVDKGTIICRGKERDEMTPLLPETHELLEQMAKGLADDEGIFRSHRTWGGKPQVLREDGIRELLQRLLCRADIKYKGHDLRRTFCTLVQEASENEVLAMRLARDKVPGVSDRYINVSPVKLHKELLRFSPIRQIEATKAGESEAKMQVKAGESALKTGGELVEAGESRTPRPRKTARNLLQD